MEAQQQQDQQQQYYYHYQTQNDAISASVDPSQVQTYDPSTQAYYGYNQPHYQQQQQQPDYSAYYYQDYSSSYQTPNDPNAIHPPGVPIEQTHVQNLYYPHGFVASQPPTQRGYITSGPSAYRGGGGRSVRGSGRGGRGKGGGRGKHVTSKTPGSQATTDGTAAQSTASSSVAAPAKPPPQMAWCEICRVDCNTLEILEQHKNGKKHKKNLKIYEELQNLSQQSTVLNPQMSLSQSKPENLSSENPQGSVSDEVTNKAEPTPQSDGAVKAEPPSGALSSQTPAVKDHFGGRGGLKRKMRGGRGGKWMRAYDGSRRLIPEPPKPKPVPLICELCNVKCESQVVYDSHIAGKKHISNVKRFEGHKEAFGEGVKELYPTIPNLPMGPVIPPANQQHPPQDAHALAAMMLSHHNLPNPQAAQTALAQLLNEHGIYDAQTLVTQLIPYLLAQFQGPVPVPGPGPIGAENQNSVVQGAQLPLGAENQNANAETKTEQHDTTTNAGAEMNDKPDDEKSSDNLVTKSSEDDNGAKLK